MAKRQAKPLTWIQDEGPDGVTVVEYGGHEATVRMILRMDIELVNGNL